MGIQQHLEEIQTGAKFIVDLQSQISNQKEEYELKFNLMQKSHEQEVLEKDKIKQKELERLQFESSQRHTFIENEHRKSVEALQARLGLIEKERNILKSKIFDLESMKQMLQQENHSLSRKTIECATQINSIQTKCDEIEQQNRIAAQEIDDLKQINSELRSANEKDRKSSEVGDDDAGMEELEKHLIKITANFRNSQIEIQRLESIIHKECKERMSLKDYIEKLETQLKMK